MKKLKNVFSLKTPDTLTTIDLAGSYCLEGMRIDTVKPQKIVFVFTFGHGVNAHGFMPTAQFGLRHAPDIDFIVPSTSNYNSKPFTT